MARKRPLKRALRRLLLVVFSLNLLTGNWQRTQAAFNRKNLKNAGSSKSLAKYHGAKTKPLIATIKKAGSSKKAKKKITKRRYLLHTRNISERRKGQFIYCITPKVLVIKRLGLVLGPDFILAVRRGQNCSKSLRFAKEMTKIFARF